MTLEIGTFEAISTTTQFVVEQVREVADFWFVRTVDLTPRLTGYLSSNWRVSFGAPSDRLINVRRVRDRKYNKARANFIQTWTVGRGNIYLNNPVEYASFIEAGRSPQAPSGMLGVAAVATSAKFGVVARGTARLPIRPRLNTRELEAAIGEADRALQNIDTESIPQNFRAIRRNRPFRGRFAQNILALDNSIRGVTASVLNVRNALLGFGGIQVGRALLDRVLSFERAERVLGVALRDQAAVNDAFAFATSEAERLGADTLAFTTRFADFLTAASFSDINAQEVFVDLASAFTNLGLGAGDFDGAFLGAIQILSRGVASTEDLRQITDRVPGALKAAEEAAAQLGGDLGDLLARGELIAEDFLPIFADILQQRIGVDAAEAVEGTGQDVQRFKDELLGVTLQVADAESRAELNAVLTRLVEVVQRPIFTEIAREIGAFTGGALTVIADNLPAIGIALSSLAALRLGEALIAGGRAIGLAIRAFTSLNPIGLTLNAVQLLVIGLLTFTGTGLSDIIDGVRASVDFIINGALAIATAATRSFEAIPVVLREVFLDVRDVIGGLFEDFANALIDAFNFAGRLIGQQIEPVNLDLERVETDLSALGSDIGRDISAQFEERWARSDPAASVERTTSEIVPGLIDISTGYDEAAADFEDLARSASRIEPAISEVDTTLGSSFASFLGGTTATFDTVLDAGAIAFNRSRPPGVRELERATGAGDTLVDASTEGFGIFEELAGDVLQAGADQFEDWTGISIEQIESAFRLGSELLNLFVDDLNESVDLAARFMIGLTEFVQGDFSILTDFLTGIWNAFFGFFDQTHIGVAGVHAATNLSKTDNSTATVSDSGQLWAASGDVFEATAGFVTSLHATTNARKSQETGSLVSGAAAETRVFEDQFGQTVANSARVFGNFVQESAAGFRGFLNTSTQAAADVVQIGQAALGGTGNILAGLDRATGLQTTIEILRLTTPRGSGIGPGIPITGTLPTVAELEAFGPLTPAQRAGARAAIAFSNLVPFEAAAALAVATLSGAVFGPGLITAGLAGVAVLGADFVIDTVAGGVGARVGTELDRLTGGAVSSTIGAIESGLRAIADATGISFVQRQVQSARDFLSNTVSTGFRSLTQTVSDFFGFSRDNDRDGGGSFSDPSSFGGRDRTSQPSGTGGIGSFAAGGVIAALGIPEPRRVQSNEVIFLDLVRDVKTGKLIADLPPEPPEPPRPRRVIANFQDADPYAVARFRESMAERGWRFSQNPDLVRRVVGNLELEAA